jgi:hypothetical protein
MKRIVREKKALLIQTGARAARRLRSCGHLCMAPLRDKGGKCCACRSKAKLCPACAQSRGKR